jgi:hypothetical protein
MRMKPAFAVLFPLALLVAVAMPARESRASIGAAFPTTNEAQIARRDPPELTGCNSRCRRVYCAESGTNRSYLCRCDCGK